MKIAKILAGMAASAIAMSTFAMVSAPVSAAEAATGRAGLTFQSNDTWNFRNIMGADDQTAAFPAATVGVQGGAYGIDDAVAFGDCDINGDGTYTVTMPTSGTLKAANPNATEEDNKWVADDASGITREGSKWSILHNFEPKTNDGSETLTQDNLTWEAGKDAKVFNILSVSTDIIVTYNADGDATPEELLDKPTFNGKEVVVSDLVVNMQGQEFATEESVKFSFDDKNDLDPDAPGVQNYLVIMLIDKWNNNNTIDKKAFVTEEDGEISCTFTVTGLAATDDSSSQADSSSTADSSSNSSSSSSSTSSTSSTTSSKSSTTSTKTTTTTTTTTTGTSSAASDSTENAASGAPAGIALALAAVAGAAVVVSRKK